MEQVHSCQYLTTLREFVYAVLAYTGSPSVHLITHSFGVTLARGVVQGGMHHNKNGDRCDVGPQLTSSVDTFIGIAGGNRGTIGCFGGGGGRPACNNVNGLDPGYCASETCKGNTEGLSEYLARLNDLSGQGSDGKYVFTMWSDGDTALGGDNVFG